MSRIFKNRQMKSEPDSNEENLGSQVTSTSGHNPSVLLAEPRISGHRLAYVSILAEEALARGHTVHVALPPGARESAEFQTHIAGLAIRIELHSISDFGLQSLATLSSNLGVSRTVVTDGDALALQLAKRGRWHGHGRLSVLIMRETAQKSDFWPVYWTKNGIKKVITLRAALVSQVDLAVLKSATWSGSTRMRVAVDPVQLSCSVSDVEAVRTDWNMDETRYWFAVLGAITSRKNVPLLAKGLARMGGPNIGLLVAGKIDPAIRKQIDIALSELTVSGTSAVVLDRTLSDIELDAAVTAADCLLLAHSNEGPSGLLGKAACAGTRVLAAGARSLRLDTQALDGLAEWTELEEDAIAAAMTRAVHSELSEASISTGAQSFLKALLPVV